jgi:indolepyruvate ferredoxin oxidoreductase beta subunit
VNKEMNVLISGLGGQGVILAARILAEAAFSDGKRALTADVVGATQRFGSAYSYVRIGEEIYSATFPEGEADLLLGFDPLQTLKTGITFASEKGLVIVSDRPIGIQANLASEYPNIEKIISAFRRMGIRNVKHFDAGDIAVRETGSIVSLNMVMLGAAIASGLVPVKESTIATVITKLSPSGTAKANLQAFKNGVKNYLELE